MDNSESQNLQKNSVHGWECKCGGLPIKVVPANPSRSEALDKVLGLIEDNKNVLFKTPAQYELFLSELRKG